MAEYLTKLPGLERYWLATNGSALQLVDCKLPRQVMVYHAQVAEIWAAKQKAWRKAWQETGPASLTFSTDAGAAPIDALKDRFAVVDDLIDRILGVIASRAGVDEGFREEAANARREALSGEDRDTLPHVTTMNNPLVTALVSIITFLSALLTVPAYKFFAHTPGTTSDSDFWFLTQSSTMQLIGLLTITLPL
jgi:hypothetical protein